jgi:glycerol-3-phosphate dehydrogenase subunit B
MRRLQPRLAYVLALVALTMHDLLVIGAGLAGLSAALAAAEAGLRVHVVAQGMGATHWCSGAVDLLGYLPGAAEPVAEPLAALAALPADHPLARLGPARVAAALAAFARWPTVRGLVYNRAADERNWLLPSALGVARPTWLAPQAQLAGDLTRSEPLVIIGIAGLRDFYPQWIAANLKQAGHAVRTASIPQSPITEQRDRNPVQLAGGLDQPPAVERLAAVIRPLVQPGERVGLPALLGLHRHGEVITRLQELVETPIFEIPLLPPSVPGLRLYHVLLARLEQLGVRVEIGLEVTGFDVAGGVIQAVHTATSARPRLHRAHAFLLATGGLLGGGFHSEHTGRCWEVIFNLPLTIPQERSRWFRGQFLHPAGHPIFTGGVAVNDQWQPVDDQGNPVHENLWAAGSVLAHTDPIRERSLEGLAIATGVAAAETIVQQR